jgi:hypothetical protein
LSSRGEHAAGEKAVEGAPPTGSANGPADKNRLAPAHSTDDRAAPFTDEEVSEPANADAGVLTTRPGPDGAEPSLAKKIKTVLVGKPRDLHDVALQPDEAGAPPNAKPAQN